MAGRIGVGVQGFVQQHPRGHRSKPDHHRSVLLPDQELHEPDVGGARLGRCILGHQGHIQREEPADAFWVQRLGPMHEPHALRGRADPGPGAVRREPVLLERLWGRGNPSRPAGCLPPGGCTRKDDTVRGWPVLVYFKTPKPGLCCD